MTPEPGLDGRPTRLASFKDGGDYWWRGFWAGQWHHAASEADIRAELDADLKAGLLTV